MNHPQSSTQLLSVSLDEDALLAKLNKIDDLSRYLQQCHPLNLLMPVQDKTPMRPHKDGVWSWQKWRDFRDTYRTHTEYAILLHTLCVVDFDNLHLIPEYEARFSELKTAPMETTEHGAHYYFLRSDLADSAQYYDGTRQIKDVEIDFKSRTSTGTGGVIVVSPSGIREWVRPLYTTTLLETISDLLLVAVATPRARLQESSEDGSSSNKSNIVGVNTTLAALTRVVVNLRQFRAVDYHLWHTTVFAISNVSRHNRYPTEGRELAHTFSKRGGVKYDARSVDSKFDVAMTGGNENPVGIGSLIRWLGEDLGENNAIFAAIKAEMPRHQVCTYQPMQTDPTCTKLIDKLKAKWEHYFYNVDASTCKLVMNSGLLKFDIAFPYNRPCISGHMTRRYVVYLNIDGLQKYLGPIFDKFQIRGCMPDLHPSFVPDSRYDFTQLSECKGLLTSSVPNTNVVIYNAHKQDCKISVNVGAGKPPKNVTNRSYIEQVQDIIGASMDEHMAEHFGRNVFISIGTLVINNTTSHDQYNENLTGASAVIEELHDNPDNYRQVIKSLSNKKLHYTRKKQLLELFTFKCAFPPCYYTVTESGLVSYSQDEMMKIYHHVSFLNHSGHDTNFIKTWLADGDIRMYASVNTFPPPLKCPDDIFNLWSGFSIENNPNADASRGSVDMFRSHIMIMVNNNEQHAHYFTKWLAQIIQEPATLTGICMVFVSGQGAGKNIFFDNFATIINKERYFETGSPEIDLFGRFCGANRLNKLLICMDETQKKTTFANSALLKHIITANTLQVEKKGQHTYTAPNIARIVITSNEDHCVKAENEERRYSIFRCSDEKKGDAEYFNLYAKYNANIDNQRAIFEYLKGVNIEGTNWIKERPITEQTAVMITYCNDELVKYFEHKAVQMIRGNEVQIKLYGWELLNELTVFCKPKAGDKCSWNVQRIGTEMTRKHTNNHVSNKATGIDRKVGAHGMALYTFTLGPFRSYLESKGLLNAETLAFSRMDFVEDEEDD